jgi:hypothetical protein
MSKVMVYPMKYNTKFKEVRAEFPPEGYKIIGYLRLRDGEWQYETVHGDPADILRQVADELDKVNNLEQ